MRKCVGVILLLHIVQCDLKLLVHTEMGFIQGLPADDGDYNMFLGIPYARVNSSNPFGASIPQPKFDKLFKAFDDSTICPQIDEFSEVYAGTLDCLRLNVYVPNTDNKNRAVLFYIHGGGFRQGYGGRYLYGPKFLVRHDVIVVTINYRLGPYGFLCTDTPEIPGNQGLKDQYTALQWVKTNIVAFGGNSDMITIDGHSSGSMCVDMHLLTKQPRLYNQAILQSGTAIFPRILVPSDKMATVKIADKLDFKTTNATEAIAFLAKIDPELIINATISHTFGICIEKEFKEVSRYVTENPELSNATNVDGLNILGGFTNRESIFQLYGNAPLDMSNKSQLFQKDLELVFDLQNIDEIVDIVQHYYSREQNVSKYEVIDFNSDYEFLHPLQRTLNKYRKHNNTTVYQYLFSYDGHRNIFKKIYNVSEDGASHADELGYLFYTELNKEIPNAEDIVMINRMTTLWTNFVMYGNPTPSTTEVIPVIWPPLADDASCLRIDRSLHVISRPFHERMAFWDLFYEAFNDRLKTRPMAARKSCAIVLYHNIKLIFVLLLCIKCVYNPNNM